MPSSLACAILAGGKSSRMGEDKALLPYGSFDTLAEYQIRKFSPYFDAIYLSCENREKFHFVANFIEDQRGFTHRSPLLGIYSLLSNIKEDAVLVIGVDMPKITPELVDTLKQTYLEYPQTDAIIAQSPRGIEPLCAIYTKAILPSLKSALQSDVLKLQHFIATLDVQKITFENEESFCNLNYPDQYRNLIQKEQKHG